MPSVPQHGEVIELIPPNPTTATRQGAHHFDAGEVTNGRDATSLLHHVHEGRPPLSGLRRQTEHTGELHFSSHRDFHGTGFDEIQINDRPSQKLFVGRRDPLLRLLQRQPPDLDGADARQVDGAVAEHFHRGLVAVQLEHRHRQTVTRAEAITESLNRPVGRGVGCHRLRCSTERNRSHRQQRRGCCRTEDQASASHRTRTQGQRHKGGWKRIKLDKAN